MPKSTGTYTLYGWEMSLYSGKIRAYLRYKGIPFREKRPWLGDMRRIQRKVGAQVMPVVVTPQGEWLQDTSEIIDALERRFPQSPVLPATPRQRIAALLLEAWGDEFWLPSAMHYRWSFPENFQAIFRPEGGSNLLPHAPRFLQNLLADKIADAMRAFLSPLGVEPAQKPIIEQWSNTMCDALDVHFATHPYLFGMRPSVGDYGLIGPLYAHLGRDPYPLRTLIEPRRHLSAWVQRMLNPPQPLGGEFLADDVVPDTLNPVFASIFGEFWPQLAATVVEVDRAIPKMQPGRGLKRSLGEVVAPMAGQPYRLRARPYSLWMAQRGLDAYRALDDKARSSVDGWLAGIGGGDAMKLRIPRLRRDALSVRPE
jgi:glutathione S-transferase